MFKIITKKEYNELILHSKEIISINDKLIQKLESSNDVCRKLIKEKVVLMKENEQLRKQLLILTPNRDAETGRFIPKYNSKKNEKKQVQQ